jgi:hypothetical protein
LLSSGGAQFGVFADVPGNGQVLHVSGSLGCFALCFD